MPEPKTKWAKLLANKFGDATDVVVEIEKQVSWAKGAFWVVAPLIAGVGIWLLTQMYFVNSQVSGLTQQVTYQNDTLKSLKTDLEEQKKTALELRAAARDFTSFVTNQSSPRKTVAWRAQVDRAKLAEGSDNIRLALSDVFNGDAGSIQSVAARLGIGLPRELSTNSLVLAAELSSDAKFIEIHSAGDSGQKIISYLKRTGLPIPIDVELSYSNRK
jgi:hypothetical protein